MLTGGVYNTSNALSRHCTADLNKDKDLAQKILNIALCFTDLQYFDIEFDLDYIALNCVALICNATAWMLSWQCHRVFCFPPSDLLHFVAFFCLFSSSA